MGQLTKLSDVEGILPPPRIVTAFRAIGMLSSDEVIRETPESARKQADNLYKSCLRVLSDYVLGEIAADDPKAIEVDDEGPHVPDSISVSLPPEVLHAIRDDVLNRVMTSLGVIDPIKASDTRKPE